MTGEFKPDLIPIRIRVEGAALDRASVIAILFGQAQQFFGDEDFYLEGDIHVEIEGYIDTMQGHRTAHRWAGWADFVNYT